MNTHDHKLWPKYAMQKPRMLESLYYLLIVHFIVLENVLLQLEAYLRLTAQKIPRSHYQLGCQTRCPNLFEH